MKLPVSVDFAVTAPLTGVGILAWLNAYSSLIMVACGVVGLAFNVWWRRREHRAIMQSIKENGYGQDIRR
ncbi:holin class II [Stenotrophomonas phage c9-N]|uniref:Holin class II n=1 Tax=Stenotrophomonas phage vB_SmeS_BUCT700 TaxID=2924895 RepID=A0AAE9K7C7_9CAUD|nr:holin class II [Stenotrophomonas phage vB_SmeS_BUCT700]WKC56434.1 holin class II [Stenotrophomonas phage c9-N]